MGGQKNAKKKNGQQKKEKIEKGAKGNSSSISFVISEPNIQLRKLYDERDTLEPSEMFSRLPNATVNLGRDGWLHPTDTEVIWLILGTFCDIIGDNDLKQMAKIIESKKLYNQVSLCCTHILEMDVENSGKTLRLEHLLRALCKTTTLYLTIASNATIAIRRNFFLDLYNSTKDPSIQVLGIKPRIIDRLLFIHCMLTGSESTDDSGFDAQELIHEEAIFAEIAEESNMVEPPDNIANWDIVPNHYDVFLEGQVFLRPNLLRTSYPDLESYQDVQFRLLMEDFMQPLRQGMAKLTSGQIGPRGIQELRIYENVTFKRSGLVQDRWLVPERESSWRFYRVNFQRLPRVNWITSRRLIHGSLVCLWDGAEIIVASVANSNPEDLASGQIMLAIESKDVPANFMEKTYVMLESVVFFEPYRAVLQVLQNFTYDSFPMMDYFLGFEKNPMLPSYLSDSPIYELKNSEKATLNIYSLMDFSSWPNAEELGLDRKQREALQIALTSRVALVQGPPGTGKTFLALRILRSLLDNKNLWQGKNGGNPSDKGSLLMKLQFTCGPTWRVRNKIFWKKYGEDWSDNRSPVVVICFTNHALDQFLEGIHGSTNRIIRIGSQSKSTILENFSLYRIKSRIYKEQSDGPYSESNYLFYFYRMKEIRAKMEVQIGLINTKMHNTQFEILKVYELKRRNIISAEISEVFEQAEKRQAKQKRKDNILKWWLGWSNHRQLLKVLRETRIENRYRSQVARAVTAIKEQNAVEFLPEDHEELDCDNNDMIKDIIDDEDYTEELRLAREEISDVAPPEHNDNIDDGEYVPWTQAEEEPKDIEEKLFADFANNQMERMQYIRDLLLAMPYDDYQMEDFSADQIMSMPLSKRWMLFAQWKRLYQEIVNQDLRDTERDYEDKIKEYNQLKGKALAALCRTADVIGMTTTGAAKNRLLLESLKAKIVIVEEAAEVLESHIVCSLTPECQQLIMIGDHQQLRPSVNVHQLATKYHLDVSLFERLIMGGMKAVRLGVQHRMRAEVARLIVPAVYAQLENHSSVYDHPHVPGMLHDVFFHHHTHPEKEDGSSFYNLHEVGMALNLARYLVRDQQVSPHRITILATYTAQLHQLLESRKQLKCTELTHVRMTVVDNFQGEENDVIILSLVRNNKRNSVGFLRIDNRVCVALSRARNGLYILGNIRMLSTASPLWAHMEKVLTENGEIGEGIPLQCDRHHQTVHKVMGPEDFPVDHFCRELCGADLPCGHACKLVCHKDGPHTRSCLEKVIKVLNCGHNHFMSCSTSVYEAVCNELVPVMKKPCMHQYDIICSQLQTFAKTPCPVLVSKKLTCGHLQRIPCSAPPDSALCKALTEYKLACSHIATIPCSQSKIQSFALQTYCNEFVHKKLLCGHSKWMKCNVDPRGMDCGIMDERRLDCGHISGFVCPGKPIEIPCLTMVDRRMPCGHMQKSMCSKPVERCHQEIVRHLDCGHDVKCLCWNKTPACTAVVEKMLMCGHLQPVRCIDGIDSVVCTVEVEVLHPLCSHIQLVPCSVAKNEIQLRSFKCTAEPLKMLECGHELRLPCAQEIDESIVCDVMINYTLPCHHMVIIPCKSSEIKAQEKCKIKCGAILECDHSCPLPCHDRSTPHTCKQTIKKQLSCGHSKDLPCFRETAKEICFAPMSMQRSCGHSWITTCGELSSSNDIPCCTVVEKRLPCGHLARVKCSVQTDQIVCTVNTEHVLGCRHTVPTKCGDSLEKRLKLTCSVEEMKVLPCGHTCHLKCGSKEASKPLNSIFCRVMVEKEIPKCGHKVKVECGKKLSKNDCTSMCEKKLNCGHGCSLLCREPCATKSCQQQVELEGICLPCGHGLRGECCLRYADQDVIEAKKMEVEKCTSPCKIKLACGHRCTERCNECLANRFHSVCVQRCKKLLICGHKCEAQCGKACPPCKKPCEYQCVHQKCSELCSEECTPCMRKCAWECPHVSCNHQCFEFCNREPCNEPCPKKFSCGHLCNGLCGEICPPKCPFCAHIKLPNAGRRARYIYLECEHFVEVEEMDEWMAQNYSNENPICKIQCPSCPQCKKAIRHCYRYGDQIKAFYVDLISIKWDYVKDDSMVVNHIEKIRRTLIKWKETVAELNAQLESILLQGVSIRSLTRDQCWDLLYRMQFTYLMCYLISDSKKKYAASLDKTKKKEMFVLAEPSVEHILERIKTGFHFMEKYANSGQGYFQDLLNVWKRLDLHRQYFALEALSTIVPGSIRIDARQFDKAASVLSKRQQWTETEESDLEEWLDRKSNFFNVNLTSTAKKKLRWRLDMSDESWFKCSLPSCEAVFSLTRYPQCPECLDQSELCY